MFSSTLKSAFTHMFFVKLLKVLMHLSWNSHGKIMETHWPKALGSLYIQSAVLHLAGLACVSCQDDSSLAFPASACAGSKSGMFTLFLFPLC